MTPASKWVQNQRNGLKLCQNWFKWHNQHFKIGFGPQNPLRKLIFAPFCDWNNIQSIVYYFLGLVTFAITGRSWDMQGLFSVQEWIIFITRKNCQRCQNLRPTQNFIIFYSLKNGTFLHTLVLFHVFFSSFYIFFLFLGSDEVSVNATKRNNFNFTFL